MAGSNVENRKALKALLKIRKELIYWSDKTRDGYTKINLARSYMDLRPAICRVAGFVPNAFIHMTDEERMEFYPHKVGIFADKLGRNSDFGKLDRKSLSAGEKPEPDQLIQAASQFPKGNN